MDSGCATIIAATIAALSGTVSAVLTIRNAKSQLAVEKSLKKAELAQKGVSEKTQHAHEREIERDKGMAAEAQKVRDQLRALAELSERVKTSMRRLLDLSRTLINDEKMIVETAQTFAPVSELFNESDRGACISLPDEVAATLIALRKNVIGFFLALDLNAERRKSKDVSVRLVMRYNDMAADVTRLQTQIRSYIAPKLEKVGVKEAKAKEAEVKRLVLSEQRSPANS